MTTNLSPCEPPGELEIAGEQGDDLVAVHDRAGRVDREHAIGVAVERDAEVEAAHDHALRELVEVRGAAWSLMLTPSGSQAISS